MLTALTAPIRPSDAAPESAPTAAPPLGTKAPAYPASPPGSSVSSTPRLLSEPPARPYCPNEYADDFSALSPAARALEERVPAYTFCIRTTAVFECPSYGPDGNLRRTKRRAIAHGTGFAYRQQNGETLILTNQHVAEWPAVTDTEHRADDVPAGCKRVSDSLKIVDDDDDSYERDDIPLSRVIVDPQLDVAILKAKTLLPTIPWHIGHSAGLKIRNAVDVRGFPLGAFKATSVGKVISAYDHDSYKDWDHDDFVVDALLSSGNSGSPVLAISCKTGEFELVGIFHAGYTQGSALNVVVSVDQIRDLMTTLKRSSRARPEGPGAPDLAARRAFLEDVHLSLDPFFPFGSVVGAVRVRTDGSLLFEVFGREFPFRAYPILAIEDLPSDEPEVFGKPGRAWFGGRQGLKAYDRAELDADSQAAVGRILEGLRRNAAASLALAKADKEPSSNLDDFRRKQRLEKALARANLSAGDLAQMATDLAERLAPLAGETGTDIARVVSSVPNRLSCDDHPLLVAEPKPGGAAASGTAGGSPSPESAPIRPDWSTKSSPTRGK